MRNISEKVAEKIKKRLIGVQCFIFSPGNCVVYEKMWKNILEPGRALITT
jgi:hypothetical protein